MKCENLLRALNDYVDGDLDPSMCDELQEHLDNCNPCRIVVDNIRQTIRLYKEDGEYEVPLRFRRRLHDAVRRKWAQCQAAE